MHRLFRSKLAERIAELAPIYSVRLVNEEDRTTWNIDFTPAATDPQKALANAELLVFNLPEDDPEDIDDVGFSKKDKAILLTIGLIQGLTPQQAAAQAKQKFKQAMQLLS